MLVSKMKYMLFLKLNQLSLAKGDTRKDTNEEKTAGVN